VNVAGFYYLYKNMQFLYTDPIPYSGGIGNIPSTHIWGGEIESSYAGGPDNRLKIDASLSAEDGAIQGNFYTLDSTIENQLAVSTPACNYGGAYYNPGCWAAEIKAERNISGNMPPKMPSVQGSIALSYDFPVYGGTFTPRVEYIYRGQMWARVFEEPSVDNIPAYSLVNLNLEYVPDDAPWKVQFAVTNLTDEAGINSRYTDPYGTFQTSNQYIPPRQFTGTVSYTFGGATSTQTAASTYTPPAATPAAPAPVAHRI
jgi:iron complex outermembrane receptor protein